MKKINPLAIKCDKCDGRVFSDREYLSGIHLELFCIMCGNRWIYHHPSNHTDFAVLLHSQEMVLSEWTTNH